MPFYTNPIYPPFMNSNFPNVDSMQNTNIKSLEERITKLEKEVNNLKNLFTKLDNNNYSGNYNANGYNMM